MTIVVCGSMVFAEQMLDVASELRALGHRAEVSTFARAYVGKSESEKEALTLTHKNDDMLHSETRRTDYPAQADQVASAYARRIIREMKLEDTAANWCRLRTIMLDALVPRMDSGEEIDHG